MDNKIYSKKNNINISAKKRDKNKSLKKIKKNILITKKSIDQQRKDYIENHKINAFLIVILFLLMIIRLLMKIMNQKKKLNQFIKRDWEKI